jgi:competence protein ComEC
MRYRVCGKIRITLQGSGLLRSEKKTLAYGDVIRTRLRLHLPKNLSDFDYREYLRRRGIYLLGALKHDRSIIKLPHQKGNIFLSWMYTIRRQILEFFASYASAYDPQAVPVLQVLQAMTLGTSRELSPDIKYVFRNSGLYHILVVSGIHIGIVAGILHYAAHLVQIPARYRIFAILPGLVIYAGLSGFQFPVLRAVIMATVLYLSITCNRVADSLYSLSFAATILVLIFPEAIFEASFQMTVTATASILGLYQCCMQARWWKWLQKNPIIIRIPLTTLFVTCGAMLGIAPLMLYYFQQLSPYSLVSNIAVFIFITPLLPFTLGLELLSLVLPWNVLYPLFSINVWLGYSVIWIAKVFPPIPSLLPRPPLSIMWFYYIGVFGGMLLFLRQKVHRAVVSKKR